MAETLPYYHVSKKVSKAIDVKYRHVYPEAVFYISL